MNILVFQFYFCVCVCYVNVCYVCVRMCVCACKCACTYVHMCAETRGWLWVSLPLSLFALLVYFCSFSSSRVCVCSNVCTCTQKPEVGIRNLLLTFFHLIHGGRISQSSLEFIDMASLITNMLGRSLSLCSQDGIPGKPPSAPGHLMSSGDPNSGPLTCTDKHFSWAAISPASPPPCVLWDRVSHWFG